MNPYAGKVRVRSCGILREEDRILLVQIHSPVSKSLVWLPPGGGVEPGESLHNAVKREFLEETGITVSVQRLLHVCEMIQKPYHAIEFYFDVQREKGTLSIGKDPEHGKNDQLIKDTGFFKQSDIENMKVSPRYLKETYWDDVNNAFIPDLKEE